MGRWRRAMQNPTLAWMVVATLVTGLLSVPVASAEVVAGFETGADLQRWSAQGKIVVQRTEGPPAPDKAGAAPPAGSADRIQTEVNSGLFIKAGELPRDLSEFDALRFWVHRAPTAAAAPSTFEVRFYEADGGAWFWRKVVLDQPGWTQVEVPAKAGGRFAFRGGRSIIGLIRAAGRRVHPRRPRGTPFDVAAHRLSHRRHRIHRLAPRRGSGATRL